MADDKIIIKKPVGYNCFACGTANPTGLDLEFYAVGDKVFSEITTGKYHVGWADIIHGGITSTLLDEVMSWTILYFKRIFFVTRKMELKYIRPVQVGVPLVISGKIAACDENDKRIIVNGELRDRQNTLLVKSRGEFIKIKREDIPYDLKDSEKEIFSLIDELDKTEKIEISK